MVQIKCPCGAVSFKVKDDAKPLWVGMCHCTSCKTAHAAPMVAITGIPMAMIELDESNPNLGYHHMTPEPSPRRYFCKQCGTRVMNGNPSYGFYGVPLYSVPHIAKEHPPSVHVCYGEVTVRVKDGLPKFRVFPPMKEGDAVDMVEE